MQGRHRNRVLPGLFGTVGHTERDCPGPGHLATGGGDPGAAQLEARLEHRHAGGEGLLGFGERRIRRRKVTGQGLGLGERGQADRKEVRGGRRPKQCSRLA
jgi:hypothetical protein